MSNEKIHLSFIKKNSIDFIISYGYTFLIKSDILDALPGRVINLHISYLPYNKGADPNFWSFVDNTPKGVTIHLVDSTIDTGGILLQEEVVLSTTCNLKSTYHYLQKTVQQLFINNWDGIRDQKIQAKEQVGKGTFHKSSEKEFYISEIRDKWLEMSIAELIDYIGDIQVSGEFWDYYSDELKKENDIDLKQKKTENDSGS